MASFTSPSTSLAITGDLPDGAGPSTAPQVVGAAADAVELLLTSGLEAAMNQVNGLDLATPPESGATQPK